MPASHEDEHGQEAVTRNEEHAAAAAAPDGKDPAAAAAPDEKDPAAAFAPDGADGKDLAAARRGGKPSGRHPTRRAGRRPGPVTA